MRKKLLFHTCCAPCSGFLVKRFSADYQVTVYFDNDNIYPKQEFSKRLAEAKKYFELQGIDFIATDYNHDKWLQKIKGLEAEPERGARCDACYWYRLRATAEYAARNGYDVFGTTLSISPHKKADIINQLGQKLAQQFNLEFLAGDWKKQDGFKQAMVLSHQEGFYHQNYCGCEFSIRG